MNNITKTLSSKPESESEISATHNNKQDELITISERIKIKKDQYEVLKIICDTYQTSLPEYMQEALIEAMKCVQDNFGFDTTCSEFY